VDFGRLELADDVLAFWNEVRTFLGEQLNEHVREELDRNGSGHSPGFHHALGVKGWIVPDWPVNEGGAGLDPLRQHLLALELRRRDASSIPKETTVIVAGVIQRWGSSDLKENLLPRIARGDVCICLGYSEPDLSLIHI